MFRIVRDFSKKKIYNFLKEIAHKKSNVLIVFENYNLECNKLVDFMRDRYGNIKIRVSYMNYDRVGFKKIINVIDPSKLTNEFLKPKFDLVCIVPFVSDSYHANKEFFGLPIKIEKPVNLQDDLISYYGLNKFVVFVLDNEVSYSKIAKIIDLLLFDKDINSVLVGDSVVCAEIHNVSMTNPVVIYNNNFLSEQFIGNAFKVFEDDQVENEQFILESVSEE